MGWYDDAKAELSAMYMGMVRTAPRTTCPECHRQSLAERTCKQGKNEGRPFHSCAACDYFAFLDLPAHWCGQTLVEFTVRSGRNKGRTYYKCPGCPKFFKWAATT